MSDERSKEIERLLGKLRESWQGGEPCEAYDVACDLAANYREAVALSDVESRSPLEKLVVGACREAVRKRDGDWAATRLKGRRVPPTVHKKEGTDKDVFSRQRRLMVLAHLAAVPLACDPAGENEDALHTLPDSKIECALDALRKATEDNGEPGASGPADVPFGFMRDLGLVLLGGPPHPADAKGAWPGLLVDTMERAEGDAARRAEGRLASLECELAPGGAGDVYPDPGLAFVVRDGDFLSAERKARQFVQPFLPPDRAYDLRWRLVPEGEWPHPRRLYGPSCGAALALAACKAAARLLRR